jgi:hypothetical protein
MRPALLAVISLALLGGCASGKVYDLPIDEARAILESTPLPPMVFGSETPQFSMKASPTQVIWIIERDGAEVMHYTATLSSEGAKSTRVSIELKGATEGRFGDVDKGLAGNGTIKGLYMVAIDEEISSALQHRAFDMTKLYPALTAATVANMSKLSASADAAAAASEAEARANIEKAYADEARGRRY